MGRISVSQTMLLQEFHHNYNGRKKLKQLRIVMCTYASG